MPICHAITAISMQWFNPRKALQLIQDEKVTLAIMVNTMWVSTLDLPEFNEFDLSRLTRGFSAGAPCPTALMKEIERRYGITMTIGYGLSETTAVVIATDIDDPDEKRLASVGRTMPGVEGKVIEPATGKVLPFSEQGEIVLRGWCNMIGYYNRPEATAEAIDPEGWLHSGDLGFLDEEGYFHVTGRMKDMIIRGGQNVYAKEIEDLLHTHPKIADVYIVGVPSRKYGEEILATVKLRSGQGMTGDEVREFCKNNIARYKVPRYVWFVESFPVNTMGKTQKFKLMDMAIAHFGLEGEKQGPTA
jgi:fatty-acyl-CoA synthase